MEAILFRCEIVCISLRKIRTLHDTLQSFSVHQLHIKLTVSACIDAVCLGTLPRSLYCSTSVRINMSVSDYILNPYVILIAVVSYWVVPYYTKNTALQDIPGPLFAKFSVLWLLLQARQGKRFQSVDEQHKKYGKFVRIQPDHVSIADETAINAIYGHGNGFLKS